MENRGSEWRKWDLHIHSPYTFLNQYTATDDEFVEKILHEDISCIGLTNYFRFDDREYELKDKLERKGIVTFLNLELRLDYLNKENDCLDLHVIFSNEVRKEDLQKLLMNVKTNINGVPKKLIDVTSTDDCNKAVVNFDELVDCLNDESNGLKGKFLIGFLSRGKGNARSSSNYEKICKKADLIIHSTDATHNIEQDKIFWLSCDMPLLQNSDAHSLEQIGKKFTWIKADTTFEGLKQIIYEPEERVKIQKEMPEAEKLDTLMIEKVTFTSSENKFTPEPIYFNKNLNVIIGGKSSGKSILLYEIAKTLYSNTADKVLKYYDTEDGQEKDLYDLNSNDANYNFSVELFSKSNQSKIDRQSQSSILPSIKYIPQNHLSNLVDRSRKNGNTLKKLIRGLILEEPEYQSKYNDFVAQAIRNDKQRNQDIEYYYSLKNELEKREKELLFKGDRNALNEGIAFYKQKIDQLNKDFKPEELNEYNELTEKSNRLIIEENQINSDFEKLNTYQTDLKRFLVEFSNKKKILLDSLQNSNIKSEYSDKLQFVDNALESINEITSEFTNEENKFALGSVFFNEAVKILTDKEQVVTKLKPFNDKLENQKQVTAFQKSISDDETKISEIEQFEKENENTKTAIQTQKQKIFTDFAENFKLYEKIIQDLGSRISEVEEGTKKIKIIPSIKYNFPNFRDEVQDLFDKRGFNNKGFEYLYQHSYENPNSALADIDYNKIEEALKNLFERIEQKTLSLKGGNTESDATKKIFTDFFFDHWDIESRGDDIHKMSTGKASFVLLQLIIKLSTEKGPILIDQPEDNLDNRSVSKELVDFLKEKKRERQIILVTHNPNIVVNADAENIIVANQKGQNDTDSTSDYKFDYVNGALENSFPKNGSTDILKSMGIREHIAEVVEGGEEAFKKRELKYSFK